MLDYLQDLNNNTLNIKHYVIKWRRKKCVHEICALLTLILYIPLVASCSGSNTPEQEAIDWYKSQTFNSVLPAGDLWRLGTDGNVRYRAWRPTDTDLENVFVIEVTGKFEGEQFLVQFLTNTQTSKIDIIAHEINGESVSLYTFDELMIRMIANALESIK